MIKAKGKIKIKKYLLNFVDDEEDIRVRKKNTRRELEQLMKVTQKLKR